MADDDESIPCGVCGRNIHGMSAAGRKRHETNCLAILEAATPVNTHDHAPLETFSSDDDDINQDTAEELAEEHQFQPLAPELGHAQTAATASSFILRHAPFPKEGDYKLAKVSTFVCIVT